MSNKKDSTEKRKHKRFKAKGGAFAAVTSDDNKIGQIKNISKGGLAFQYLSSSSQSKGIVEIDIFSKVDDFYLKELPVRVIKDFEVDKKVTSSSATKMQMGLQFEGLKFSQQLLLDYFVQYYTHK